MGQLAKVKCTLLARYLKPMCEIGLLTAAIAPYNYKKGYKSSTNVSQISKNKRVFKTG
jgi:hypothetical protein